MKIENLIIDTMLKDEDYARKTCPYITEHLFESQSNKCLFKIVNSYYMEYKTGINETIIRVIIDGLSLSQNIYEDSIKRITESFSNNDVVDVKWLLEQTNIWIKERAVYNGVLAAVTRIEEGGNINDLPEIFKDALSRGFNDNLGMDLLMDTDRLIDVMINSVEKMPFSIDKLNQFTNGGLERKSLTVILAGTGVGKTMAMCSLAADDLRMGRNIVYFTAEISEEKIAQRIYANLYDTDINMLPTFNQTRFKKLAEEMNNKYGSSLIIKEYPTSAASTADMRTFLRELFHKRGIAPDMIYADYLGLFNSIRHTGRDSNSYERSKAVAEEFRGIGVEYECPFITATQTNKGGFGSSDVGLTDTSESFGVPMTADLMLALMETPELRQRGLINFKILKNRFAENNNDTFLVGVDKSKMKIYNHQN